MEKSDQLTKVHFEKLSRICAMRHGRLLSGRSRDGRRIKVQCAKGHVWNPDFYNLLKGTWCSSPECVSRRISEKKVEPILRAQIDKIRTILTKKEAVWVDGEYLNNRTKISLRCKEGHPFSVAPGALLSGSWCPICAGRRSKDEMYLRLCEHAAGKGGRLLSKAYAGVKTKLKFQCKEKHAPWMATPESVLRLGTWCPACAPNGVRLDIKEVKQELDRLAASKGGKCISIRRNPSGHGRYLCLMRCSSGHRWNGALDHLRRGVWCPACNSPGVREKICRAVFEWLTGRTFMKHRPLWLVNSRGHRMELDGYNKNLGLAFEYQGEQHSEFIPFFHRDHAAFLRRKFDDSEKQSLCSANGVDLIRVDISVPLEGLQEHVFALLTKIRPSMAAALNHKTMDVNRVATGKDSLLAEIRNIASANGGECLSTQYVSANSHLIFRCSHGHTWAAVPSSVRQGAWCKACVGKKISASLLAKRDITPLINVIEQNGGVYLGQGLKNKLKLRVKCSAGHEWETDKIRLLSGRWCQKCRAKENAVKRKMTGGG